MTWNWKPYTINLQTDSDLGFHDKRGRHWCMAFVWINLIEDGSMPEEIFPKLKTDVGEAYPHQKYGKRFFCNFRNGASCWAIFGHN